MATKNPRIAVNLTEVDHVLVEAVQRKLSAKAGIPITMTDVVRLALRALAKQEKVTA